MAAVEAIPTETTSAGAGSGGVSRGCLSCHGLRGSEGWWEGLLRREKA